MIDLFSDNPLDCTCQLADFQGWLKTSTKLDKTSRNEATCVTPTNLSNAKLYNVTDLVCRNNDDVNDGDDDIFDISTLDLPPAVSVQKQIRDLDTLSLFWEIRLNYFKCQNIQIFAEDDSGNQEEVYSRPFDCEKRHSTPHGVDYVTTSIEMSKIVTSDVNNASLLACLVLLNEEVKSKRAPVVSGCSKIVNIVQTEATKSIPDSTDLTLLHAFLNWNRDAISVFFSVQGPMLQNFFAVDCATKIYS